MSWFKELTSKAEAMLVKLDQDAAQALQNPENLLGGTKSAGVMNDTYSASDESPPKTEQLINENDNQSIDHGSSMNQTSHADKTVLDEIIKPDVTQQHYDESLQTDLSQNKALPQLGGATSIQTTQKEIPIKDSDNIPTMTNNMSPEIESQHSDKRQVKKFTIQSSKANTHLFMLDKHSNRGNKSATVNKTQLNGYNRTSKPDTTLASPDANDIRASINRSLQEYTIQTFSTSNNVPRDRSSSSQQTTYQSHFDNQPNIIQHLPLLETGYDNVPSTSRLHSSPSFSIDVPEDATNRRSSNDIALRLLQQSASKKKSTFYLHKVINQLANPNGRASTLLSDQMRIKFRRSQLRVASYARRLNYYFRAYPMMKYLMVGYLVLMQLLVIYVLFFYQSSGSSTELSSQIKQQQQELTQPQMNSESNLVNDNPKFKNPGSE